MESVRKRRDADLKLVPVKPHLNVIARQSVAGDADTVETALFDPGSHAPMVHYSMAQQAESFIDTSQNWPVCMLDAPPSQAGRIRVSYALLGGVGAACGILLVQDLFGAQGLVAQHPIVMVVYAATFFCACFVQFNLSSAARARALFESLKEKEELDRADEQEYARIEKQERQIKSCLGLKAFGLLSLILVAATLVSSPISGRVSSYDSVHVFSTFMITWFWLLGVQQQPSRAAIFGFVAACVSLTAASLISGGVQFADLFSYVSTSIIVGLVINRSGTQNLGWPPIVALFLSRLFACGVALVVAHLQTHGWRIEILMTNVYVPMIITVGWSVGLLIANAIVNDAAYVDKQGRPVIPNAPSDSELCSLTQKVLAEEVFLKAEELANQPGSERITEEHYKRAISLYPYEHRFYLRLAQMYNRLHRYKEAQILFQVTTRVCPQATDAWQSLAALLYNHKQYSRAREACRQALKCATIDGEQLRLVTLCLEDSEKRMLGGKILRFNRA